jgi:pentose-5-phosphate-3-epimerase
MDPMHPGDRIIIHVMATHWDADAKLIRIEHRRDGLTLTPPTPSEVLHRVLKSARPWSKSNAGLPDA